MRLLQRRRLDDDVLELPVLAVVGETLLAGERFHQQLEAFDVTLLRFAHRYAERIELFLAVAPTDTHLVASARQQIERGDLFGKQHRVVPRQHDDSGAKADAAGAGRKVSQEAERGGQLPRRR
jgi:hypothetical protein